MNIGYVIILRTFQTFRKYFNELRTKKPVNRPVCISFDKFIPEIVQYCTESLNVLYNHIDLLLPFFTFGIK